MPHTHTYSTNLLDQNLIPSPPHRSKTDIPLKNRASRSLESWLLSDLGRLSMTSTTQNPTKPTRLPNNDKTKPKSPPKTCYTHTHYTSSSPLCECSCSSSLASGSSFPRSRGRTPSTSSSCSVRGHGKGVEDGDGLPTYTSATGSQGRVDEALKPFG